MAATTRGAFPYPNAGDNWKLIRDALAALANQSAAVNALFAESTAALRPAPGTVGRFHRATDTGVITYDTGTAWQSISTKTIRIPHTFTVSGEVKVDAAGESYIPPFPVPVPAGQAVDLASVRVRLNSGTSATCELRKNSVIVGTAFTVSSSTWATVARTTTFADLDDLALVVTSVSGTPKGLSVAALLEYEV